MTGPTGSRGRGGRVPQSELQVVGSEFACRRHGWGARPGGAGRAPLARGPTPPRAKWLRGQNGSLLGQSLELLGPPLNYLGPLLNYVGPLLNYVPPLELLGASLELRGASLELLGASIELLGASLELLGAPLELPRSTFSVNIYNLRI